MTRRKRRIAFGVYAVALFIGTHIPNFRVEIPQIDRPDLILHMLAFGGWLVLFLAAEFFGPWRTLRSIALCTIVAAAYACIDEYSQSMPGLNRTAAFDDLLANLAGVTLAAAMSVVAARTLPGPEPAAGQSPRA